MCFYLKKDIAISVAEEDVGVAEQIAQALKNKRISYYLYTEYENRVKDWGQHILKIVSKSYGAQARYVLVLSSETYVTKYWSGIELMTANVFLRSKRHHILQLRLDSTPVPGLDKNISHQDWKGNPDEIAGIIRGKLQSDARKRFLWSLPAWLIGIAIFIYALNDHAWQLPSREGVPFSQKNGVGIRQDTVLIGSSSFTMGSNKPFESPAHMVRLDSFYISTTEVTVAQYGSFCKATGRASPLQSYPHGNYPVVNVSWSEAMAYCQWAGGRLPTEAEWEYAAGAGKQTRYAGGENAQNVAVYNSVKPREAGSKNSNVFGLYDMSGNAAEWCSDWFAPGYASSDSVNPAGPKNGKEKVVRGGSYKSKLSPINELSITYRDKELPNSRKEYIGFRVVWDKGSRAKISLR